MVALQWLVVGQPQRDMKTLAYSKTTKFEKDNNTVGWAFGATPLLCREWQIELQKHETSGYLARPHTQTKLTALALVPEAHGASSVPTSC